MTLALGFSVRLAVDAADFAFILALLQKEQWNPGTRDAVLFPRIDPNGFFLATLDGKPVGCISAVSYVHGGSETPAPHSFGFIGLYIIEAEHRGKGFGMALWSRAMSRFAGHQTIGLDAVAAQVPNYIKSGFVTAYRDVRFMISEFHAPPLRNSTTAPLVPLDQVPIGDLVAFDARYFGVSRKRFLETWAEQAPEMHGVALLNKATEIRSYGAIRQGATGYRVGPLFAQDSDSARIVLVRLVELTRAAAAASSSGSIPYPSSSFPVYLDAPDVNRAAGELMQALGMKAVSECARMYHGPAPEVDVDGIFATTTDI
ncbi:hypothetical protein HDU89_003168 [Geranomyces variabilis]|nr:hypothetical protein HDU89_003168 [Geranomyces variabilis]